MHFNWKRPNQTYSKSEIALAKQLHLPVFIIDLLNKRNIKTPSAIRTFLNSSLNTFRKDISLPAKDNLLDITKTCRMIKQAIKKHRKIQLYDDYDTDGITSASIMYILIHHYLHYENVSYYIPERFRDGYGPNLAEYQRMYRQGMQLLITTDNGISGLTQIAWLKKHHVKVIITDHHEWPTNRQGHVIHKRVPNADAICMANCPYHRFHFDDFCGAGIAFMIACKMLDRVPKDLLDLACLGTVADSVSLRQENRIIVKYGLQVIHHDKRKGIKALAGEADVNLARLTSTDLSFTLIPRLNAIGRMSNANMAVELLTTDSTHRALEIAQTIEEFNDERKKVTNDTVKEAFQQAELPENQKRTTLVIWSKHWFPGIVGIVGSHLIEKFHKPALVCGHLKSDSADVYRGSGRSIPEFNLFSAMQPMQQYANPADNVMTSFGGHPMACGFTIKKQNLNRLSKGLELAGKKAHLDKVTPTIQPDIMIKPSDISKATLDSMKSLEPFGVANEQPTMDVCLKQIYNVKAIGKQRNHLSFTLEPSWKSTHVIAFGMGDKASQLENDPFNVELVGTINLNHYKGHDYVQFMVQHLRYYTTKPPKKDFVRVYKYLYARHNLHFTDYQRGFISPLSVYLHMSPRTLNAIIKVFHDLHLCKISSSSLIMALHPKSVDLHKSKTYQQLL